MLNDFQKFVKAMSERLQGSKNVDYWSLLCGQLMKSSEAQLDPEEIFRVFETAKPNYEEVVEGMVLISETCSWADTSNFIRSILFWGNAQARYVDQIYGIPLGALTVINRSPREFGDTMLPLLLQRIEVSTDYISDQRRKAYKKALSAEVKKFVDARIDTDSYRCLIDSLDEAAGRDEDWSGGLGWHICNEFVYAIFGTFTITKRVAALCRVTD